MIAHRIFTICLNQVVQGAEVARYHLRGAGIDIPAILVGEDGRGRQLGILPVAGAQPGDTILAATIGQTKSGRPKLIAAPPIPEDQEAPAVLVMRTPIGYRGGNAHRGPQTGTRRRYDWHLLEEVEEPIYAPLPGQPLAKGIIAQGAAGRMGRGEQLIQAVSPGDRLTVRMTGRLSGGPRIYAVRYDGKKVISLLAGEEDLIEDLI